MRLERLHRAGVRSWTDVLESPDRVPTALRHRMAEESDRCLAALEANDVRYFVERFAPQDRWRILSHFHDKMAFFDVETMGLEHHAAITVIVCWHAGELHCFVEHENLDAFLELLDGIVLLGSFNGSAFDVPRILNAFHIPELPCPHLDLRWPCYHQGLRGGLKQVAARCGITRPADLVDADGAMAAELWRAWTTRGDRTARDYLVRYCAADVLMLVLISQRLAGVEPIAETDLWRHLPEANRSATQSDRPEASVKKELLRKMWSGRSDFRSPTR